MSESENIQAQDIQKPLPHPPPAKAKTKGRRAASSDKEKKLDKDRKKLVVACTGCRKKKIKCSADRPACTNCLRLNIPCEYPVVRNRGSRFGYMEMLNRRMQHLEKYINCSTNPEYRPQFVSIHQKAPLDLNHILTGTLRVESAKNTTSGYTSIKPTSDQGQNAESLITQLGPSLRKELTPPARESPNEQDADLPPEDIVLHLVELYFRHVHGQTYSFLHKPTFIPRIKEGKVNRTLLLAICGLTARYSRHPSITSTTPHEAGEKFIAAARKALSEEFDEPTLETAQAVIIIVQHDFFRSKGKKSMIYVSLAIRMATTLGLHIEPQNTEMSFREREERRRTYWSLIVLDRLAHSGPHWQVHLRTDTLNLQLPCKDYYYENNIPVITETLSGTAPLSIGAGVREDSSSPLLRKGELGLYAFTVIVTILWCDINKYVMEEFRSEKIPPWKEGSTYHSLEKRLQQIFSSLPKAYQYSRENLIALDTLNKGSMLVHLHAELVFSLCYLSRSMYPFNYSKMKFHETPPAAFIERAAINIMTSANAQSAMIEDVLAMEDFHMAPFIGFGVFTLSSVHIANSYSQDPAVASAARNNLALNLKFLVIMREYWYSVGVWCIILKDRYFQKAKRRKIQSQHDSYEKYAMTASSVGIIESIPDHQNVDENKTTDAFSRPGTPPLAYAPEDTIVMATNGARPSDSSQADISSNGLNRYSPSLSHGKSLTMTRSTPDSSARMWERAAHINLHQNLNEDDTAGTEFIHPMQDRSDTRPPSKRVKFSGNSPMTDHKSNGSSPASPSQYVGMFSMPSLSHLSKQETKLPEAYSVRSTDDSTPNSINNDPFSLQNCNGSPVGITGLGNKSRNNLLLDTSGEWLNSLELTEFNKFANDEGSLVDINNPTYWFNAEMKVNMEEQDYLQESLSEGSKAIIEGNGSTPALANNSRDDRDNRFAVSFEDARPSDLRQEDASLFQQSLLHQPFTPDIPADEQNSSHKSMSHGDANGNANGNDNDNGNERDELIQRQQVVPAPAPALPARDPLQKSETTLLDEMFQKVTWDNASQFSPDGESPEDITPSR